MLPCARECAVLTAACVKTSDRRTQRKTTELPADERTEQGSMRRDGS